MEAKKLIDKVLINELINHDLDRDYIERKCDAFIDYKIVYNGKYDIIKRGWSYMNRVKHSEMKDEINLIRGIHKKRIKVKRFILKILNIIICFE